MRLLLTSVVAALLAAAGCGRGDGAPDSPAPRRPDATGADAPAAGADPVVAIPVDPADVATELVAIPASRYYPIYADAEARDGRPVAAFRIERHAVTNAQFRSFVAANPSWRRSRIAPLFTDDQYLAHWQTDLSFDPGDAERPVTNVSWFAARAYARWLGRRLPTIAEWEVAAMASNEQADARDDPEFVRRILAWYGRPARGRLPEVAAGEANVHGVHDLHGVIWEWVEDFNTALVTGESRGDSDLDRNLFCGSGAVGAADPSDYAAFMRYAFRSSLEARSTTRVLGFRCATTAETSEDR